MNINKALVFTTMFVFIIILALVNAEEYISVVRCSGKEYVKHIKLNKDTYSLSLKVNDELVITNLSKLTYADKPEYGVKSLLWQTGKAILKIFRYYPEEEFITYQLFVEEKPSKVAITRQSNLIIVDSKIIPAVRKTNIATTPAVPITTSEQGIVTEAKFRINFRTKPYKFNHVRLNVQNTGFICGSSASERNVIWHIRRHRTNVKIMKNATLLLMKSEAGDYDKLYCQLTEKCKASNILLKNGSFETVEAEKNDYVNPRYNQTNPEVYKTVHSCMKNETVWFRFIDNTTTRFYQNDTLDRTLMKTHNNYYVVSSKSATIVYRASKDLVGISFEPNTTNNGIYTIKTTINDTEYIVGSVNYTHHPITKSAIKVYDVIDHRNNKPSWQCGPAYRPIRVKWIVRREYETHEPYRVHVFHTTVNRISKEDMADYERFYCIQYADSCRKSTILTAYKTHLPLTEEYDFASAINVHREHNRARRFIFDKFKWSNPHSYGMARILHSVFHHLGKGILSWG